MTVRTYDTRVLELARLFLQTEGITGSPAEHSLSIAIAQAIEDWIADWREGRDQS
jgi:predicted alternative tryptophan synthase beta-subunit